MFVIHSVVVWIPVSLERVSLYMVSVGTAGWGIGFMGVVWSVGSKNFYCWMVDDNNDNDNDDDNDDVNDSNNNNNNDYEIERPSWQLHYDPIQGHCFHNLKILVATWSLNSCYTLQNVNCPHLSTKLVKILGNLGVQKLPWKEPETKNPCNFLLPRVIRSIELFRPGLRGHHYSDVC